MKRVSLLKIFLILQFALFLSLLQLKWVKADTLVDQSDENFNVIKRVDINIIDTLEDRNVYVDMARRLIRLSPGDLLTTEKIKTAIDALKLSNRFSDISVDSQSDADGEIVVFELKPFRFIKDISISGSYPLFEKDIYNRMTIYPGEVYRQQDLSKQKRSITELYKQEGYINPEVDIKVIDGLESGDVTIGINIKKGSRYLPGKLTFKGNHSIGGTWLKPRMRTWRLGLLMGTVRFTEARLKKDIERLISYYRKHGFADVKITYRLDTKTNYPEVDAIIDISEGPRYELAFEGNGAFKDKTLKKEATLFTEGNRRGLGVRKSIRKMRQLYLKAGFMDAKIVSHSQNLVQKGTNVKKVTFDVTEGPCTKVLQVYFEGNQMVGEDLIREQVLTRPPGLFHSGAFVQETLNDDVFAINTLYLNKGYLDAKVESTTTFTPDRSFVEVAIKIEEGRRTQVGSVSIDGFDLGKTNYNKKELSLKSGNPFKANLLKTDESYLSSLVSEKGYPHVVVTSKVKKNSDHTRADIIYQIDPGPIVHLGKVFVSGNLKTREKVVLRELETNPGEPLSLQKLTDAQRKLRNLDIFRSVQYKAIGLREKEDPVNLFVEIQESKPYYTQFSLGYESDVGYVVGTEVGNSNFMGLNRDVWMSAEYNQTGYEVETGFAEPRIFDSMVSLNTKIYNDRTEELNQTFGTNEFGAFVGFGREWSDDFSTTLGFDFKQIDQFGSEGYEQRDDPRTVLVGTPALLFDNRDSFIKPTKGWYSVLSVDISKRIERLDQATDDFFKYNLDLRFYHSPLEYLTFAWMGRFGYIQPYGNDEPPQDQLFYLGGINDVRGFRENMLRFDNNDDPVGGKSSIVGSFEARIDIGWNLDLTAFFDTGSVQDIIPNDDIVEDGSDEFRSSAGLGLRYMTAIGPVGLLYGRKLDIKEGESPGQIHFSIGYTF